MVRSRTPRSLKALPTYSFFRTSTSPSQFRPRQLPRQSHPRLPHRHVSTPTTVLPILMAIVVLRTPKIRAGVVGHMMTMISATHKCAVLVAAVVAVRPRQSQPRRHRNQHRPQPQLRQALADQRVQMSHHGGG